jgi:hypothetical protein
MSCLTRAFPAEDGAMTDWFAALDVAAAMGAVTLRIQAGAAAGSAVIEAAFCMAGLAAIAFLDGPSWAMAVLGTLTLLFARECGRDAALARFYRLALELREAGFV